MLRRWPGMIGAILLTCAVFGGVTAWLAAPIAQCDGSPDTD